MLLIIPVLLVGSLCFLIGSRHLAADQARADGGAMAEDMPIH
jgi:hypothetical protein